MSQLNEHTRRIEAIGRLAGAEVATDSGYPAWQPSPASPLLGRARDVYERIFNTPPRVETIHAGLECGTIGNIFPGMDMLSLGATIRNAHSPAESLHLPSVQKVWLFLVETLASFCQD
jgi:dipeptidase D